MKGKAQSTNNISWPADQLSAVFQLSVFIIGGTQSHFSTVRNKKEIILSAPTYRDAGKGIFKSNF